LGGLAGSGQLWHPTLSWRRDEIGEIRIAAHTIRSKLLDKGRLLDIGGHVVVVVVVVGVD
jgi:hypothetical protein